MRLEAEEELRWEIARATGGTQADTNTVEATAEAAAAVSEDEFVVPEMYTRDSAEAMRLTAVVDDLTQRLRIVAKDQTGIKDLLIKDMIEDWWKKNEQERMNSKMTSAAESSMSSAD